MSYKRLRASGLQRNSDSSRMRDAGKRRVDLPSNQCFILKGQIGLPWHLSLSRRALVDLVEP